MWAMHHQTIIIIEQKRNEHYLNMFINLYVEIDAIWCIKDMQSIANRICWWHMS